MISYLENDCLKVAIDNAGAELASIKLNKDHVEYLWQGDAKYWGRRSPILFPIVGKLNNDSYNLGDKIYRLSQHGFARDMDFLMSQQSPTEITYVLVSNDISVKRYPFNFELKVEYVLEGNKILVRYCIKNTDKSEMYFSIGAHPGFNCPILPGESMEDYYLEFENKEETVRYILEDGLISERVEPFLRNANQLQLSQELFKDDAIILKDLKSTMVTMKSKHSNRSVCIEFAGFPYLGIWSKSEGAPFICIEPWYGIADNKNSDGNFDSKEGIQTLEPLQEFNCQYSMIIE